MPTFDVVSELDEHEVKNAIDQASREVSTRYDLKDADAQFVLEKDRVRLAAKEIFHLQQMLPVLQGRLSKRGVDLRALEVKEPIVSGREARQEVLLRSGIDAALGKKLMQQIKGAKLKVQTQMMESQMRVTGKKRDDLQQVIALLREGEFELPLQFINFRD